MKSYYVKHNTVYKYIEKKRTMKSCYVKHNTVNKYIQKKNNENSLLFAGYLSSRG